jgi:hypothetical protein
MISPDNLGCEDILSDVPELNKNLKELGFDVQINVPEYME